jgi:hypothetical protein
MHINTGLVATTLNMLKILDEIELVEYDARFDDLYYRLLALKKETFEFNERIVIWHTDTEYFYYNHPTGFITHNLFSTIRKLDIPLFVFIILTNQSQYQISIAPFIIDEEDYPEIHNLIVNSGSISFGNIRELLKLDIVKDIKFHAVCLLGTPRNHRIKLFQFLKYSRLDQSINFSFNDKNVYLNEPYENKSIPAATVVDELIFTIPHRINDSWVCKSTALSHLESIKVETTSNQWISPKGVNFYQYYSIDIITETVFDYPHVFISEKTLRPIALKTAFVMFGAAGTLKYLKEHGFKTFDNFWDESYDTINDPHERFLSCCNVLTELTKLSINNIKEMYIKMLPILEHNRQTLSDYIDNVYDPLYNKIKMPKDTNV